MVKLNYRIDNFYLFYVDSVVEYENHIHNTLINFLTTIIFHSVLLEDIILVMADNTNFRCTEYSVRQTNIIKEYGKKMPLKKVTSTQPK